MREGDGGTVEVVVQEMGKQSNIVSFKYEALKKYNSFREGKVEKIEGIELIRAIENNLNLGTFTATNSGFAVDVNQDLMKAIDLMPTDKIRKLY